MPPTSTTTERELLIYAARALSVCLVVLFHAGLWRVSHGPHGCTARTMELGPVGWYGSWLLMVMPVFFVAGGYAHAIVVDKMHRRGTGLAHYWANRGRRLVGPTTEFVTIFAVPATIAAWTGHLDQAVFVSHNLTKLLWFLVTYLLIVLLAPALVAAHDRFGHLATAAPFAAATAVDLWAIRAHTLDLRYWNLAFAWLACHQIGIAHQRGFLRRGPLWQPMAAITVGVAMIVLLLHSGWPVPAVGVGSI